jgi:peptidoglycan-associated lipoprotein
LACDLAVKRFKRLSLALLPSDKNEWRSGSAGLLPVVSSMVLVRSAKTISKNFAAVVLVMFALTFAATGPRAQSNAQLPGEMLKDGLEALSGNEDGLAAQLFEQLILAFPGTTEADRASQQLSLLGSSREASRETSGGQRSEQEPRDADGNEANDDPGALRMKFAVEAGDRVFFAENSAVIGGRARALLENQARWLHARPNLKITVIGRADDGGPEDEARVLSAKRAEAVRDKLISGGVAATRILIDGRGTRDPVATCHSALCQAQNRHAETLIGGGIVTGAGEDQVRGASINRRRATIGGAEGGVTVSR